MRDGIPHQLTGVFCTALKGGGYGFFPKKLITKDLYYHLSKQIVGAEGKNFYNISAKIT